MNEQSPLYPLRPDQILEESFRIIEREVKEHPFSPLEWPVVRRMIHASGDLDLVKAVHFQYEAAWEGIQAFQQRTPIVTDVQMVAAGIQRRILETLGINLHCFINEPEVHRLATTREVTRSYCAMEKAIADICTAVYVIGNAPTALLALCEAVRQARVCPRLVIAMPVGFVSVVESKEQAVTLPIPLITVRGRKGGSAMAAAAVNALLLMALEKTTP